MKNSWSQWSQSGRWKGRRTMEDRICGKGEFWAWSGREKEYWMVTVVKKEMTNWRVWDQMRVISLHDQQAGEVPWEADSRDRVMRDGKSGCWPSERKRKVDERGLQHLKNECYDGAKQRWDYIDMKAERWWGLYTWEKEYALLNFKPV